MTSPALHCSRPFRSESLFRSGRREKVRLRPSRAAPGSRPGGRARLAGKASGPVVVDETARLVHRKARPVDRADRGGWPFPGADRNSSQRACRRRDQARRRPAPSRSRRKRPAAEPRPAPCDVEPATIIAMNAINRFMSSPHGGRTAIRNPRQWTWRGPVGLPVRAALSLAMARVILVRHCESESNRAGPEGGGSNSPLSARTGSRPWPSTAPFWPWILAGRR